MSSIEVTQYTVYPTGYAEAETPSDKYHFAVTVNDRGKGWSVQWMGEVLNKAGEWEYEPLPSSRDDAFFARCRFTEEQAKALALAMVDTIEINGRTFATVLAGRTR